MTLRADPRTNRQVRQARGRGPVGTDPKLPNMKSALDGVFRRIQSGQTPQQVRQELTKRFGGSYANQVTRAYQADPRRGQVVRSPGAPDANPAPAVDPYTDPNASVNFDNVGGAVNREVFDDINAIGNRGDFQAQGLPELNQDYNQARQRSEQAVIDKNMRYLQPQFDRQMADFRQRMAEQGVPETSEAYQKQFADLQDAQNRARADVFNDATQTGRAEQQQQFGQALQGRGQMFGEQLQTYQQPLNVLSAYAPYYGQNANIFQQQQQFGQERALADLGYQYDLGRMQADFGYNTRLANQAFGHNQRLARMRSGGGGGGGGGIDPYDRQLDNLILGGAAGGGRQQRPSIFGGAAQGFGSGVGLGLVGSMMR